jgi:beta-glucosidase
VSAFDEAVAAIRAGTAADTAAAALLAHLTGEEKLGLLDGDEPFWPGMPDMMGVGYNLEPIVAGAVERLGIPGIRFADGPRGAVIGHSTAFPVPMARGATWDPELEERVGQAIGAEIAAQGGNYFGGVCVNLLRHPAWGRAQETYGEEPLLLGVMGRALARGAQRYVMACVKHYACNSMENARFTVDVRVDDRSLHEIYLPHFRMIVEAGVASVMSAYNSVNGEWCGQNRVLLTDILRDEWGFTGFVVSDFIWGLRDPAASLAAGLDIEMPFAQQRARAVALAPADVDRSALRILATQLRFAASVEPAPSRDVVVCAEHLALARTVASRSMVLLRNEGVLPLDAGSLRRVAVVGRLADVANTGDHGSSDVRAPSVVTPLEGLRAALPWVEFVDDPAAADAAVVVVGYTYEDEGEFVGSFNADLATLYPPAEDPNALDELARAWDAGPQSVGGDRDSLRLHPDDEELIHRTVAANPRTVVVVLAGAAVTMPWAGSAPAVLLAWYPGMAGGSALADVLLGAAEPGGRLPFAIPADEADLAPFDKHATEITYDRWYGQRKLDRDGIAAAFPLGFGLSYTRFTIAEVSVLTSGDGLTVSATVANRGSRPGGHVVQVYGWRDGVERVLLGFTRVEVAASSQARVELTVPLAGLSTGDGPGRWRAPAGDVRVEVGGWAGDPNGFQAVFTV